MNIENAIMQFIIDNDIATDSEISLVTNIFGTTKENLNNIIYCRTGYHDYEQIVSCVPDEYLENEELNEYYDIVSAEED